MNELVNLMNELMRRQVLGEQDGISWQINGNHRNYLKICQNLNENLFPSSLREN